MILDFGGFGAVFALRGIRSALRIHHGTYYDEAKGTLL